MVKLQKNSGSKKQQDNWLQRKLAALTPERRAKVEEISNQIIANNRANTSAWVVLDSDKVYAIHMKRKYAREIATYRKVIHKHKLIVKRALIIVI